MIGGLAAAALAADPSLAVGVNANASTFGLDADDIRRVVDAEIRADLALDGQDAFLGAMARAVSSGSLGMAVDYTSAPEHVVIGGSFGMAVARSDQIEGSETLPGVGVSTQSALMLGVPLRAFVPEGSAAARFEVYVGGMGMRMPRVAAFDARAATASLQVQASLVEQVTSAGLRWGGVDLTSGVVWSTYRLSLAEKLAISADVDPVTVVWRTEGDFDVVGQALVVPIELTTSMGATFLDLFGGVALDARSTRVTSAAALSGNLIAAQGASPEETHVGDATLNLNDRASAAPLAPRVLTGIQIVAGPVRLYGQGNLTLGGALGAHAGVRGVW